jgi:hypothetical protein
MRLKLLFVGRIRQALNPFLSVYEADVYEPDVYV